MVSNVVESAERIELNVDKSLEQVAELKSILDLSVGSVLSLQSNSSADKSYGKSTPGHHGAAHHKNPYFMSPPPVKSPAPSINGSSSAENSQQLKDHITRLTKKSEDRKTSLKLLYSILTTKEKEFEGFQNSVELAKTKLSHGLTDIFKQMSVQEKKWSQETDRLSKRSADIQNAVEIISSDLLPYLRMVKSQSGNHNTDFDAPVQDDHMKRLQAELEHMREVMDKSRGEYRRKDEELGKLMLQLQEAKKLLASKNDQFDDLQIKFNETLSQLASAERAVKVADSRYLHLQSEVEELNKRVLKLETELKNVREERDSKESLRREQLVQHEARLAEVESKAHESELRVRESEAKLRESDKKVRDYENKFRETQSKSSTSDETIRSLELKLKEGESRIKQAEQNFKKSEIKLEEVQRESASSLQLSTSRLQEETRSREAADNKANKLDLEIRDIKARLISAEDAAKDLLERLKHEESKSKGAESTGRSLDERTRLAEERIKTLEGSLKSTENKLKLSNKDVQSKEDTISSLEGKVVNFNGKIQSLQAEIDNLTRQELELKSQLKSSLTNSSSRDASLQDKITALQKQKSEIESDRDAIRQKVSHLENKNSLLNKQIETNESSVATLRQERAILEEQVSSLKRMNTSQQQRESEQQSQQADLDRQLSSASEENLLLRRKLSDLEQQLRLFEVDMMGYEAKNEEIVQLYKQESQLRDELNRLAQDHQQEMDEKDEELKEMDEKLKQERTRVAELETKASASQINAVSSTPSEKTGIEKNLQDAKQALLFAQNALRDQTVKVTSLQAQLETLQEEALNKENEVDDLECELISKGEEINDLKRRIDEYEAQNSKSEKSISAGKSIKKIDQCHQTSQALITVKPIELNAKPPQPTPAQQALPESTERYELTELKEKLDRRELFINKLEGEIKELKYRLHQTSTGSLINTEQVEALRKENSNFIRAINALFKETSQETLQVTSNEDVLNLIKSNINAISPKPSLMNSQSSLPENLSPEDQHRRLQDLHHENHQLKKDNESLQTQITHLKEKYLKSSPVHGMSSGQEILSLINGFFSNLDIDPLTSLDAKELEEKFQVCIDAIQNLERLITELEQHSQDGDEEDYQPPPDLAELSDLAAYPDEQRLELALTAYQAMREKYDEISLVCRKARNKMRYYRTLHNDVIQDLSEEQAKYEDLERQLGKVNADKMNNESEFRTHVKGIVIKLFDSVADSKDKQAPLTFLDLLTSFLNFSEEDKSRLTSMFKKGKTSNFKKIFS